MSAGSSVTDVARGNAEFLGNLLNQRGLADLSRPAHDVQEPSRLAQSGCQHGGMSAAIGFWLFTHYVEYFYSA